MLSQYPFAEGSTDSDAFEDFFASISLPDDDAVASARGSADQTGSRAAQAARAELAIALNIDESTISIMRATPREWSDSCLGLGRADESCAQMITDGFVVVLEHDGTQFRYRTNADGTVLRAEA
jgi:hypothetical protein